MFVNFDITLVKLKITYFKINIKYFIMKCRLFQEKLQTIFHNKEGNNENTNDYI